MRRHIRHGIRLKHLNASGRFPSGNTRYYYRPHGKKGVALPDLPSDDPRFLEAYQAASKSDTALASKSWATGSIGAAIRAYEASDVFLALAPSTRARWRNFLEEMRSEYGNGLLRDLQPRHIRAALAKRPPHPANNRLKVWRALGRFWVQAGLIDINPAKDVEKRAAPKSDGFVPWTRDDVAAFRKHWPHNTQQRLCMELIYVTCAAIGDACRLGPGMVTDGWITYTRQKSKTRAIAPIENGPDWFEPDHHFAECLRMAPKHMTYLTTYGKQPRSAKAARQWFAKACRDAGFEKSAHGLRKHRAAVFAENGATTEQRMAILGHETTSQARDYSKSADMRKIITGTELSNSRPTSIKK